ncbi:LCP family protein [Streptacidiphilus jiangxiensis]|uniref:Cell envelope-related function transcriptional attenuator common domain-containing protein n=1 Tax=Streptacidiphilus jiangxiensis TaxID=235985 RepID=A0A1H7YS36_STRJI|nr:LCP family protein [Streptacidiphilus jiangxiensis]SEM48793.1 cell envelope-related function transcriptional attenuator common domain-containing protein [Streptacidiphilus jiangxiensis]
MDGSSTLPSIVVYPTGGLVGSSGRRRRVVFWLSLGLGVLLLLAVGTVWIGYTKLNGNIHADTTTDRLLGPSSSRPTEVNGENILVIGSDSRAGANAAYGTTIGARSDTTILLHIGRDRRRAVAVSLPRDAMVDVPACELPSGKVTAPYQGMFNSAYEQGGTACTIRTVEKLTDIRIDHFVVVDFTGFKKMVDAVGGVEVCLSQPVVDKDAALDLPAGRQTLDGEQALGYVRVRYALGDGSDTQRMGRQQDFLSSLVAKIDSSGVLLNPTRLYPLLDAATSSLTVDPGLDSLSKLYDLASSLSHLPASQVSFLTAPREPYVLDRNRDQFKQPDAAELFRQLRNDQPVTVSPGPTGTAAAASPGTVNTGVGSTTRLPFALPVAVAAAAADPTPAPTYTGRSAAQDVCATP